jgi:hypothetical protein
MVQQMKSVTSLMEVVLAQMGTMENNANLNAIVTFKAVKTTNADLTVVNVNVRMDIQEFIVTLTFQ